MNLLKENIIQSILSSNAYIGCKSVVNFEELKTVAYSPDILKALIQVLHSGDYQAIACFEPAKDLLGEDLTVIRFDDERGKQYYGLYYDSILLAQDPEVIEIVPYKQA